jgi:hypothetical protein
MGAILVADKLVNAYIEDVFLPDIVLEILTKNRVYENVELYSPEVRAMVSVR